MQIPVPQPDATAPTTAPSADDDIFAAFNDPAFDSPSDPPESVDPTPEKTPEKTPEDKAGPKEQWQWPRTGQVGHMGPIFKGSVGDVTYSMGPIFEARYAKAGVTDEILKAAGTKFREFLSDVERIVSQHFASFGGVIPANGDQGDATGATAATSTKPRRRRKQTGGVVHTTTIDDRPPAESTAETAQPSKRLGPWRSIPLRELSLDSIKGISLARAVDLEDQYPAIGDFADLADQDEGTGLLSLAKIGKKKSEDIKALINTFIKNFDPEKYQPAEVDEDNMGFEIDGDDDGTHVIGNETSTDTIADADESTGEAAQPPSQSPPSQDDDLASFVSNDVESRTEKDKQVVRLYCELKRRYNGDYNRNLTSRHSFQAGYEARERGWGVAACTYIGIDAVDWVKGWLHHGQKNAE